MTYLNHISLVTIIGSFDQKVSSNGVSNGTGRRVSTRAVIASGVQR